MRIAVSGAHRTGKTTLVELLRQGLRGHEVVEEPYHVLEAEGHLFGDPPSLEDFERQLERSIQTVRSGTPNRIFDRCPADFLAYLAVHRDRDAFDPDAWMPRVREAMKELDLVVLVPIDSPERITLLPEDRPKWRRAVDAELRTKLLDDPWEFGVTTIEVRGDPEARCNQVMRHLA